MSNLDSSDRFSVGEDIDRYLDENKDSSLFVNRTKQMQGLVISIEEYQRLLKRIKDLECKLEEADNEKDIDLNRAVKREEIEALLE